LSDVTLLLPPSYISLGFWRRGILAEVGESFLQAELDVAAEFGY
jgi:hypothetical protein